MIYTITISTRDSNMILTDNFSGNSEEEAINNCKEYSGKLLGIDPDQIEILETERTTRFGSGNKNEK